MRLNFKLEANSDGSRARAASFATLHGRIATPVFMPVGTFGSIHALLPEELVKSGSQIILGNTYHLWLRPGTEVFDKFRGIHAFMGWPHPVLTDSGGFQIFSLPGSRKISEAGALFQSYVDGRTLLLSPEQSIAVQRAIGSDIMMVLDQCLPSLSSWDEAHAAMELTHRWAVRSLAARQDSPQALFGIVQGACFEDLRRRSAEFITSLSFDGFAIGGLAVGEGKTKREDFTEFSAALLPPQYPRYLMGVGTPLDLLEAVHRGVDMFDCIIPTLHASQGLAYTFAGKLSLSRSVYKMLDEPLDASCGCYACGRFSKAYLHHLVKTKQVLAARLLSEHNIYFFHVLMSAMRKAIFANNFADFYRQHRLSLGQQDARFPSQIPKLKLRLVSESLGDFEICRMGEGASIRHVQSQEVMHAKLEPDREAQALYIEQSQLRTRVQSENPLVIWDVGLGAAHNAMAAIHTLEAIAPPQQKVSVFSFELDLNPLKLALGAVKNFKHLRHSGPHELLKKNRWASLKYPVEWQLILGDFAQTYAHAPVPDIIYYDPFSTKTNFELWTLDIFRKLNAFCAGKKTSLYTYTASTSVRAALLGAGFYVGKGEATGNRSETTVAKNYFDPGEVGALLQQDWLERWKRSDAKFALDLEPQDQVGFAEKILAHPQFA